MARRGIIAQNITQGEGEAENLVALRAFPSLSEMHMWWRAFMRVIRFG